MNVLVLVSVFRSVEYEPCLSFFFFFFLRHCGFCNPLSEASLRYDFFNTAVTTHYIKLCETSNNLGEVLFWRGQRDPGCLSCLSSSFWFLSYFLHHCIFGSPPSLSLQPVIKKICHGARVRTAEPKFPQL